MTDTTRRSRRRFLRDSGAAVAGLASLRSLRIEAAPPFDLLLRGGTVLDGTGAPAFAADVAVAGDDIAALGAVAPEQARRVIDVSGLQVCPGFIDIHSHSDGGLLVYPGADSRVRQGVTTELTGNCGSSSAPLSGKRAEETRRSLREDDGIAASWTDVASYLACVDKAGVAVNHALLLGQGTLRSNVAGVVNRPLETAELETVLRAVEDGLQQGAFGLSTGLEYTPGRTPPRMRSWPWREWSRVGAACTHPTSGTRR